MLQRLAQETLDHPLPGQLLVHGEVVDAPHERDRQPDLHEPTLALPVGAGPVRGGGGGHDGGPEKP